MFEQEIEWLYASGITRGSTERRFCPTAVVRRAEMASFLSRALALPATATDYFRDDEGSKHEDNINRVAAEGISPGCAPAAYCPAGGVSRGQMASFLARALALTPADHDYFGADRGCPLEDNVSRIAAPTW